jgi:hypothetical protein
MEGVWYANRTHRVCTGNFRYRYSDDVINPLPCKGFFVRGVTGFK